MDDHGRECDTELIMETNGHVAEVNRLTGTPVDRNPLPIIRQIRTVEERNAVVAAAKQDGHNFGWPTHVVERDGEIIGAMSAAVIPLVCVWNHTSKVTVRDSLHLARAYSIIMDGKGATKYWMACDKTSPYSGYLAKVGFKPVWETQIFESV